MLTDSSEPALLGHPTTWTRGHWEGEVAEFSFSFCTEIIYAGQLLCGHLRDCNFYTSSLNMYLNKFPYWPLEEISFLPCVLRPVESTSR